MKSSNMSRRFEDEVYFNIHGVTQGPGFFSSQSLTLKIDPEFSPKQIGVKEDSEMKEGMKENFKKTFDERPYMVGSLPEYIYAAFDKKCSFGFSEYAEQNPQKIKKFNELLNSALEESIPYINQKKSEYEPGNELVYSIEHNGFVVKNPPEAKIESKYLEPKYRQETTEKEADGGDKWQRMVKDRSGCITM